MKNRLRELREAKGWSQQHLAEKLHVSRQTVISIELGKHDPSLPLAFAITAVFSAAIEDIFSPQAKRRP